MMPRDDGQGGKRGGIAAGCGDRDGAARQNGVDPRLKLAEGRPRGRELRSSTDVQRGLARAEGDRDSAALAGEGRTMVCAPAMPSALRSPTRP
ncbi:hypothetical protein NHU_03445 [Rhodovulum sulfidophilum]|uniref:Uncharacterized protein n=1 Tax=Rhodovulum sulfidophilum TaxID=35806 RepID=A0A0D6B767_RHOSU|nr:hypothetical protein NHU_03445 [Rhodovulum sulfidophilum]